MSAEHLLTTRLGQRGEGVAAGSRGPVYVPYALPDETILADVDGDIGQILEMIVPRSDRIAPICPYFGTCGGCAVQALPPEPYAAWKRGLVVDALSKAGVAAEVMPLIEAHGAGRRRATFHARVQPSPNVLADRAIKVGFMRARAHEVIDIAQCPILAPSMQSALPAARVLANILSSVHKPLDLVITAAETGLDVDLRGIGPVAAEITRVLAARAATLNLARLSNHGDIIIERRAPILRMGKAEIILPPGAFLQSTVLGEQVLSELVLKGVGAARRVADLFCGLGTFALRLAEQATIRAYDMEGPSLSALSKAARAVPSLRPVSTEPRDLFRRPLAPQELAAFDAVVFDPPRAGASAQAEALAASKVPKIVAVSCNPATFARDAHILISGGYRLETVAPIDQFLYSPHVEIVAAFRREKDGTRGRRALFG
jgi:23S rRNA (uracil1939-C5)-methyltransferase